MSEAHEIIFRLSEEEKKKKHFKSFYYYLFEGIEISNKNRELKILLSRYSSNKNQELKILISNKYQVGTKMMRV